MNKQNSIEALENQKQKIRNGLKPEVWIDTTSELLKKIFPISGVSKSKHISDIYFYPFYERNPHLIEQQVQKGRIEAERYIQEFIDEINITGIEKVNDENQIMLLIKNTFFWFVLTTFVSGSFFIGNYFGSSRFDREKTDLYNSKQKIEDELLDRNARIDIQSQMIKEKDITIDSLKRINQK